MLMGNFIFDTSFKYNFMRLTRRFSKISYALVPGGAKLAHFGLREEISRD